MCPDGLLDVRWSHDVRYTLALSEKVIGNDAPLAAPPYGFGTHDRAPVLAAQLAVPQGHRRKA
jgi:hypothetical protein